MNHVCKWVLDTEVSLWVNLAIGIYTPSRRDDHILLPLGHWLCPSKYYIQTSVSYRFFNASFLLFHPHEGSPLF